MNIIRFICHPELINSDLSPYQETALRLLYGLPLNDEQKEVAGSTAAAQDDPRGRVPMLEQGLDQARVQVPEGVEALEVPASGPTASRPSFLRPAVLLVAAVVAGVTVAGLTMTGLVSRPGNGTGVRELGLETAVVKPVIEPATESLARTPRLAVSASIDTAGAADEAIRLAVAEAVEAWAEAWSGQRVEDYLASYSPGFRPADGMSRSDWVAVRRERLSLSRFVRVTLGDLQIEAQGVDRATATFDQTYESDTFNDRVRKILSLEFVGENWKISSERDQ